MPACSETELILLHDDADIVAVDKPAALAAIPGRGESDSVIEQLSRQLSLPMSGSADPRLRVVHRLDKDTSGVLLLAKHVAAQRHLSHQFQNNTIEKQYLALVAGHPDAIEGEIDGSIGPHPRFKLKMAVLKHGRPAKTLWRLEERFRGYSLIRVFPKTGKTHQIRVHLHSIGLPLAIDPLYNHRSETANGGLYLSDFKRSYRPSSDREERPLIARLTLHAEKLRFDHPNGNRVEIVAQLPKDFAVVLNQLRRHGR
jgi:23S rRNA pseudouridine1911/1915/1917 synthase